MYLVLKLPLFAAIQGLSVALTSFGVGITLQFDSWVFDKHFNIEGVSKVKIFYHKVHKDFSQSSQRFELQYLKYVFLCFLCVFCVISYVLRKHFLISFTEFHREVTEFHREEARNPLNYLCKRQSFFKVFKE